MWLAKPARTQRQADEDAVEWARKETWTFTLWKCKVYGLLLGVNVAMIAFISKGMPGHILWRWLGIPLSLAFASLFTAFLFYASHAVSERLDLPRKRDRISEPQRTIHCI
jgi:hypothetical protein